MMPVVRTCCATLVVLFLFATTTVGAETLKVTSKCGKLEFVGAKDDGSHRGGFQEFSGLVQLEPSDPAASRVELEIQTASLWSDNPKLTAHLRNADFFDVKKFPKATFQSTAVRAVKPEEKKLPGFEKATHVLTGKLTLLGLSRKLDLPMRINLSDEHLAVEGTYRLDRTQFGMTYGQGKIHDAVEVHFTLKIPRKSGG